MQKCEFLDLERFEAPKDRQIELGMEKKDELELPAFVREIPVDFKRKDDGKSVAIDYEWQSPAQGNIKIRKLVLKKGEPLEGLYRINAQTETETMVLDYKNTIYVLRKTTGEVAAALLRVSESVCANAENIVGYVKTLLGSFYVISKIPRNSWVFDEHVSSEHTHCINAKKLNAGQKTHLFGLIIENLISLNINGLIIKDFTLGNVILTNDSVAFTDLRNLRAAGKKSLLVDEFRKTVKYLASLGFAGKADVFAACAHYYAAHGVACKDWHREKTGNGGGNEYDIALRMESEL